MWSLSLEVQDAIRTTVMVILEDPTSACEDLLCMNIQRSDLESFLT